MSRILFRCALQVLHCLKDIAQASTLALTEVTCQLRQVNGFVVTETLEMIESPQDWRVHAVRHSATFPDYF